MRRHAAAAAVLAALAMGAPSAAPASGRDPSPGPRASAAGTTAIGVVQREFRFSLYRRVVNPGRVRFNVMNRGEDAHDLVIRGPRGFRARAAELRSGERTRLVVRLRREGRYRLVCTVAGHSKLGMKTTLTVRKASRSRRSRRRSR